MTGQVIMFFSQEKDNLLLQCITLTSIINKKPYETVGRGEGGEGGRVG